MNSRVWYDWCSQPRILRDHMPWAEKQLKSGFEAAAPSICFRVLLSAFHLPPDIYLYSESFNYIRSTVIARRIYASCLSRNAFESMYPLHKSLIIADPVPCSEALPSSTFPDHSGSVTYVVQSFPKHL